MTFNYFNTLVLYTSVRFHDFNNNDDKQVDKVNIFLCLFLNLQFSLRE